MSAITWFGMTNVAEADVVVIVNRTSSTVRFGLGRNDGTMAQMAIEPRGVLPVVVLGVTAIEFSGRAEGRQKTLAEPNSACVFHAARNGLIELRKIGPFGEKRIGEPPAASPEKAAGMDPERQDKTGTLAVKILVDEEERMVPRVWQARLRRRIAAASKVFEQTCRIRISVVATGTWQSNDEIRGVSPAHREFAAEVDPSPADVAIGFTRQFAVKKRFPCGVLATPAPFCRHVLIAEGGQVVSETERLEILVHTLGHFLGAVHSPEPYSVMRRVLADEKVLSRGFSISFDPANALAVNLTGCAWRFREALRLGDLDESTRVQLQGIYSDLARWMPDDPGLARFSSLLERPPTLIPETSAASQAASVGQAGDGVKAVLLAIEAAAEESGRPAAKSRPGQPGRLRQDALTELSFRRAAGAAAKLDRRMSAQAFLVGLAIATDRDNRFCGHPEAREICGRPDVEEQRRKLATVRDRLMMLGRDDLARHFAAAGAIAVLTDTKTAETMALVGQAESMEKGAGFSFVKLAADLAGIVFAEKLSSGQIEVSHVAKGLSAERYMPAVDGLAGRIGADEFRRQFRSIYHPRCRNEVDRIYRRIRRLPAHGSK